MKQFLRRGEPGCLHCLLCIFFILGQSDEPMSVRVSYPFKIEGLFLPTFLVPKVLVWVTDDQKRTLLDISRYLLHVTIPAVLSSGPFRMLTHRRCLVRP